jgi:hypothetical protein
MAQSKARFLSSLLTTSGFVKGDRSQLAGSDGSIDSASLPVIANAMLAHSGITINDLTVALGDSQDLTTTNIAEGTRQYYTTARVDSDVTRQDLNMGGNRVLFANVYSTEGDLPSASTYHGMFAHVHGTGKGYFAHGGAWHKLLDESSSTTTDLTEGINKYFTEARARASMVQGTGLTYDSASGTISITNTGVTAGTYGSASLVPVFTVNAQGQIDSVGTVSVAGVSSINFDSSNGNFTINTADGQTFLDTITLDPYTTSDLSEGSNQYYTNTRADARIALQVGANLDLSQKSTSDLSEGSNQYYTDARARAAVSGNKGLSYDTGSGEFNIDSENVRRMFSATGDLSYDSSTGIFSFDVESVYTKANFDSDFNVAMDSGSTDDLSEGSSNLYYTDTRARNAIGLHDQGGDGSLTYDSAAGRFSYTGPSAAETRAHFSGSTGITLNSGAISITNSGVSAGTFGSATQVPQFSVNAQGQIDSAKNITIAGVTGVDFDSSNGTITVQTTGGNFTDVITLDPFTTANLTENTNLYYTDARARASVSVNDAGGDGSLSYNNSTGVLTYTGPSAAEVRAHLTANKGLSVSNGEFNIDSANVKGMFSAGGDLSYSNGVFSYTDSDRTASQIKGLFSGGTGVTYNDGAISIGQAVGTSDNVQFADVDASGNVVITGNLTVNGATVTNSATNTTIEDALIELGSGNSGANANDLGLILERGSTGNNVFMGWDESIDRVVFATTTATGASTGDLSLTDANVQAANFYGNLTGAVTGNADTATALATGRNFSLTGDVTASAVSFDGTGAVALTTVIDSDGINHLKTDDLPEGSSNLYHTTARARGAISVNDAGGDGSASYNSSTGVITYTGPSASEVRAHFSASSGIDYNSGTGAITADQGEIRGFLSASGDLSYDNSTGEFSFSETYSSAAELLTAIKTVDGATSGLDADLLDGQHGAYYRINVYDASGTLQN